MQNDKQHDIGVLKQLNVQLGDAESKGEVEWLAGVIGPELAFR